MLVAPAGSPEYVKEPHTSCWRVLPRTAPQTLDHTGHPLLKFRAHASIGAPRTTARAGSFAGYRVRDYRRPDDRHVAPRAAASRLTRAWADARTSPISD